MDDDIPEMDSLTERVAHAEARMNAHERMIERSVPAVLSILTRHMAKVGLVDPRRLGSDLRDSFNEGLAYEDATGLLLSNYADEVDAIDTSVFAIGEASRIAHN